MEFGGLMANVAALTTSLKVLIVLIKLLIMRQDPMGFKGGAAPLREMSGATSFLLRRWLTKTLSYLLSPCPQT